jgi:hypothetical protein
MKIHPDLILKVSQQQLSVRDMFVYTLRHTDYDFRKLDKYIKDNLWVWSNEQYSMLENSRKLVRKRKVWVMLSDSEMKEIEKHNVTCKKLIVFLKKMLKEWFDENLLL